MKVYVINFQEVINKSSGNALVRDLLKIFEELDDNYVFLTSYVDKNYKSNIKGHGKFFYLLYRLVSLLFVKLHIKYYISRTILEKLVDIAHFSSLRKEKAPYILITTQYAPYSVKLASQRNNKTILLAGNLNDELYYDVVTKEKERLGLRFQDIYSSEFRINVFRKMMKYIDEVWCGTPLCVQSFKPKNTKLIPVSIEIKKKDIDRNHHIVDDRLTLGYIGHTSLLKGVHLLVNSIERSQHRNKIKLVLCGSIDPQMEQLLHNKKVNVEYRGYIPEEEKLETISSFDCLVIPSLFDAGPTTIIEGIRCNIPVIASNGCGFSDLIKNISGCFVFETQNIDDLTNKIDYIFENKKDIIEKMTDETIVVGDIKKNVILEAIKAL